MSAKPVQSYLNASRTYTGTIAENNNLFAFYYMYLTHHEFMQCDICEKHIEMNEYLYSDDQSNPDIDFVYCAECFHDSQSVSYLNWVCWKIRFNDTAQ